MKKENTFIIFLIISVVLVLIIGVVWVFLYYQTRVNRNQVTTFEEFKSLKGEVIKISSPKTWDNLTSPLEITGEVRGDWSFEGSFPIVLANEDGLIITDGFATLEGEWMTSNYVPFKATITFTKPETSNSGMLLLKKDNPSDIRELDDVVEIPVTFKTFHE